MTYNGYTVQHNAKMAKKHKNRLVTVEVIDVRFFGAFIHKFNLH